LTRGDVCFSAKQINFPPQIGAFQYLASQQIGGRRPDRQANILSDLKMVSNPEIRNICCCEVGLSIHFNQSTADSIGVLTN